MSGRPRRCAPIYAAGKYGNGTGFALADDDGMLTKVGRAFPAVGSMERTPLRVAETGGDDAGPSVEACTCPPRCPRPARS